MVSGNISITALCVVVENYVFFLRNMKDNFKKEIGPCIGWRSSARAIFNK